MKNLEKKTIFLGVACIFFIIINLILCFPQTPKITLYKNSIIVDSISINNEFYMLSITNTHETNMKVVIKREFITDYYTIKPAETRIFEKDLLGDWRTQKENSINNVTGINYGQSYIPWEEQ